MADDNKVSYFFLGLGLGVAAGLLLAPQSGEETRNLLKNRADEGKDYLKRRGGELRETAADAVERGKTVMNDAVEKGRTVVSRQRDQVAAAVEAGKQAYREAMKPTVEGAEGI